MSVMLSIDYIASQTLKWVTKGSEKNDPGSIILFEPQSDGTYSISTNTSPHKRVMFVTTNGTSSADGDNPFCAVRSKAVDKITDKVEEDTVLSIELKDDKVILSSGATSFKLDNLYDSTMIVHHEEDTHNEIRIDYAELIPAITRAQNIGNNSDIRLQAVKDENIIQISSGDDDIHSNEIFTASPGDDFTFIIPAAHLKAVNESAMKKIEPDDVTINSGHGLLEFVFTPLAGEATSVKKFHYVFPTFIGKSDMDDNLCDDDFSNGFIVDKRTLSSAVSFVSAATKGDSVVTLDATQGVNRVSVKVNDNDGSAQTTVVDAQIDNPIIITISSGLFLKALKAATGKQITVGLFDDDDWVSITPVFNEDAESESSNSDIIIAARQYTED